MARAVACAARTLVPSFRLTSVASSLILGGRRGRSSGPRDDVELIEIELSSCDEPSSEDPSVQAVQLHQRLEDAAYASFLRRVAPDWLPFLPGSSYWAPDVITTADVSSTVGVHFSAFIARLKKQSMSREETLSLFSSRGFPSSAYFVEGRLPHPVKRMSNDAASQTDDEEN